MKYILKRFLNSCILIAASLALIVLCAATVTGLRINTATFPGHIGNTPENVARVKEASDPNDFTFAVVGDVKGGTATFEAMLDVVQEDKPAFAVVLGDFVGHAELIDHKLFTFEMAEHTHNFPLFVVPGNHDIEGEGSLSLKDFEKIYGPSSFSFTFGRNLFILLNDIFPYNETEEYLKFTEQAIVSQREKTEKIFVFMHVPPSGVCSSLLCNPLPASEKFLALAGKYHIDYVFAGDHHGYVKTEKDGTTFIVSGGGGAHLRGVHGKFHHLTRIAVKDGQISETVIASKRHLETAELIERNLAVYLWPLIEKRPVITLIFSALIIWILVSSIRRARKLKKS